MRYLYFRIVYVNKYLGSTKERQNQNEHVADRIIIEEMDVSWMKRKETTLDVIVSSKCHKASSAYGC